MDINCFLTDFFLASHNVNVYETSTLSHIILHKTGQEITETFSLCIQKNTDASSFL